MKKRGYHDHWPQGQVYNNYNVPLSNWFEMQVNELLLGYKQK